MNAALFVVFILYYKRPGIVHTALSTQQFLTERLLADLLSFP